MDIQWSFAARSIQRVSNLPKVLAAAAGIAALAGIYPASAAIATAMATSLRVEMPKPAAAGLVSAFAAERNSLGLRRVLSNPTRQE